PDPSCGRSACSACPWSRTTSPAVHARSATGSAHPAPALLGDGRQDKVEYHAMRVTGRNPDAAFVSLDDRTADGEAHAHPIRLGRVERLEDPIHGVLVHSYPGIRNRYPGTIAAVGRPQMQHPRPRLDRAHRVDRVDGEVEYDLL